VNTNKIKEIISALNTPLDDSSFFEKIFSAAANLRKSEYAKDADNFKRVCAEEYDTLSKQLDKTQIQDPAAVRNVLRTRRLANLLINDKGELNKGLLPKVIAHLTTHLYFLGPRREYDSMRQEQILKGLTLLRDNPELAKLLRLIGRPYSHRHAEQIIRNTLQLPENAPITDAHARRAALSAWLCTLRQSIGSCFATAPAIIIHDEQPEQLLKDLNELLSTGRLKRTYEGIEHSVPLSMSWGGGDLRRILYLIPDSNHEIWTAPGLIAAFTAGGLIDFEASASKKIDACKTLIVKALDVMQKHPGLIVSSVEKLIRTVFLQHYGITEQDVEDFENRPRNMIQSSLLLQAPTGAGGKGEACSQFLIHFEKAKDGFKALADNALLKSWEFTLASFSEIKSGFTRWNLYSSLGLNSQENGGIGECLFKVLKMKLDEVNEKVKSFQIEYEQVYTHVKYLETRIKRASETEGQWLKAELQSKANEFYSLENMRDRMNNKAARLANLFNDLVQFYDEMFPRYFQEVYDADMHDVSTGPYDDSPAGFRLIYKHGRMNTSQWTPIRNLNEFVDSLVSFFVATESELLASEEMSGLEDILTDLVTRVVNHIKTKEFLESAFYRMAAAHNARIVKDPLNHLDQVEKKPWVYVSGGTMETLISCYYRRGQKPTIISRWVESPSELLVFLVDTAKQIPYKEMEIFKSNNQKSMLMQSPTHAFLFKPGFAPFKEAWQTDAYTYTWVRDQLIEPMKRFVERQIFDEEQMQALIQTLKEKIPSHVQHYFKQLFGKIYGTMTTVEFRNEVLDKIEHEPALRYKGYTALSKDDIDSFLYSLLPLFPITELQERVFQILQQLPGISIKREIVASIVETMMDVQPNSRILNAKILQDVCKAVLLLILENTSTGLDYHQLIAQAAQKLEYAMPQPIRFADTNWLKEDFAFVVNPGTAQLELWRVDFNGTSGYPMTIWEQWLNGSRQDVTWGIYTKYYEYVS